MTTSVDIAKLRNEIRTSEPPHGTICIVRAVTDTHLEAKFDPEDVGGWVLLPLTEIKTATVLRQLKVRTGEYSLVQLELTDEHPQVEIAALTAQLNQLLNQEHCSCTEASSHRRIRPQTAGNGARTAVAMEMETETGDPSVPDCYRFCKPLKGCQYWGCLFGCIASG